MASSLVFSYCARDLGPGRGPLQLGGAEKKISPNKELGTHWYRKRYLGAIQEWGTRPQGSLLGFSVSRKMETRPPISRDTLAAIIPAELLLRDMSEDKSWG